jgi:hypothetical protein
MVTRGCEFEERASEFEESSPEFEETAPEFEDYIRSSREKTLRSPSGSVTSFLLPVPAFGKPGHSGMMMENRIVCTGSEKRWRWRKTH